MTATNGGATNGCSLKPCSWTTSTSPSKGGIRSTRRQWTGYIRNERRRILTTFRNPSGLRPEPATTGKPTASSLGFDGDWGTYDFSSYTQRFDSGNWALYANDTFELGKFALNAGLRYDNNLDFGSQLSPSGGVVYQLIDQIALLRGQIAHGFSAPPGAWVTDPIYGNKNLQAETAINYQLGGEVKLFKVLKVNLNLFRADVDNLLRFNPSLGQFGLYENIAQATRRGIEGRIGAAFDWGLGLSFGGSFIDVRDGQTDEIIQDVPRILYDASASYTYKWMSHSLIGRYVFNNSSFPETKDQVFVFDYMLKVKLPFIPDCAGKPGFFFTVHNIFNTTYLLRNVYPQPGRWVEGGVSYQF